MSYVSFVSPGYFLIPQYRLVTYEIAEKPA